MKNKIVVWCMVLLFNAVSVQAENIKGIVMCSEENSPVQNANVYIFSEDSLIHNIYTDYWGKFEVSLVKGRYRIQVKKDKYLTLEDSLLITVSDELRELKLTLHKEPIILDEVIIKASPLLLKNILFLYV